jgi:hypothetical protein
MDIEQAFQLMEEEETIQDGWFLVLANGNDINPDGTRLAANAFWRFVFATSVGDFRQASVWVDMITSEPATYQWQCDRSDQIDLAGFTEQVQLATTTFEQEDEVDYRPGNFFVFGTRSGGCASGTGNEETLVGSRSGADGEILHTLRFNAAHPEGVRCEQTPLQTCE